MYCHYNSHLFKQQSSIRNDKKKHVNMMITSFYLEACYSWLIVEKPEHFITLTGIERDHGFKPC